MHTLDIYLECEREEIDIFFRSISVEVDKSVNIEKVENGIRIIMEADTASRLRAIMNSYMKWMMAIKNIKKVII